MGRTLDQVMADLPPGRRDRVVMRYRELKEEVERLHELRELAGDEAADRAPVRDDDRRRVGARS